MFNKPSCETSVAPLQEKILIALREELVSPRMQDHLLDPQFVLGLDNNPGNGEAGLLAANALLVIYFN